MADVTIERIAAVQDDLAKAIVQTSERSTLSGQKQDQLLEQSCAQACDLLTDWLASDWWHAIRPSNKSQIGEFVPDRKHFEEFLGPTLKDALSRASRSGVTVPPDHVDQARKALEATASRNRKMTLGQLYQDASLKVATLKTDVCGLADHLHDLGGTQQQKAARRQRARKSLTTVGTLVPALVIGMAGVDPGQAAQNLREWDRQFINVMALHDVTELMTIPSTSIRVGATVPVRARVAPVQRVAHIEEPVYARGPRVGAKKPARLGIVGLLQQVLSRRRVPQRVAQREPVRRRR